MLHPDSWELGEGTLHFCYGTLTIRVKFHVHRGWADWFRELCLTRDRGLLARLACTSPVTLVERGGRDEIVLRLAETKCSGDLILREADQQALLALCEGASWPRLVVPHVMADQTLDLAYLGPQYMLNQCQGVVNTHPSHPVDYLEVSGPTDAAHLPESIGIMVLHGNLETTTQTRPVTVDYLFRCDRTVTSTRQLQELWRAPVVICPPESLHIFPDTVVLSVWGRMGGLEGLPAQVTQVRVDGLRQGYDNHDLYYRLEGVWCDPESCQGLYDPPVIYIRHWSEMGVLVPGWSGIVVAEGVAAKSCPPGWTVHLSQRNVTVYRRIRAKSARSAAMAAAD